MTCMSVEPAPNEQCRIVVEDSKQNRPCIQVGELLIMRSMIKLMINVTRNHLICAQTV